MTTRRKVITFLVVVALMSAAGAIYGTVVDKAFGAEQRVEPATSYRCAAPCSGATRWSVDKYRKGRLGHSSGFNPSRVWRNPVRPARSGWTRSPANSRSAVRPAPPPAPW